MKRAKTIIKTDQRTKDDASYIVKDAIVVRLMNKGQTRIWIDEQEVIEPGEAFVDTDDSGAGIHHRYTFNFLPNPNPPAEDRPLVYPGNMLQIRIYKKSQDGR